MVLSRQFPIDFARFLVSQPELRGAHGRLDALCMDMQRALSEGTGVEELAARLRSTLQDELQIDGDRYAADYGSLFINVLTPACGCEDVLKHGAHSLPEMVQRLGDLLHLLISGGEPMMAHDVWVDNVEKSSFHIHCFPQNDYFLQWIEGVTSAAGSRYFGMLGVKTELFDESNGGKGLCVFAPSTLDVLYRHTELKQEVACKAQASSISLDAQTFYNLFPFHFAIDSQCRVVQAGNLLERIIPNLGSSVLQDAEDFFQIHHPSVLTWSFDKLLKHSSTNGCIVLRDKSGLELKGSLVSSPMRCSAALDNKDELVLVFLVSPLFKHLGHMEAHGLRLCDFPAHTLVADLVVNNDISMTEGDDDCSLNSQPLRASRQGMHIENLSSARSIDATPANMAISLIGRLVEQGGHTDGVTMSDLTSVRDALLNTAGDINRPVPVSAAVLDKYTGGDKEVTQGLMDMLVTRNFALEDGLATYGEFFQNTTVCANAISNTPCASVSANVSDNSFSGGWMLGASRSSLPGHFDKRLSDTKVEGDLLMMGKRHTEGLPVPRRSPAPNYETIVETFTEGASGSDNCTEVQTFLFPCQEYAPQNPEAGMVRAGFKDSGGVSKTSIANSSSGCDSGSTNRFQPALTAGPKAQYMHLSDTEGCGEGSSRLALPVRVTAQVEVTAQVDATDKVNHGNPIPTPELRATRQAVERKESALSVEAAARSQGRPMNIMTKVKTALRGFMSIGSFKPIHTPNSSIPGTPATGRRASLHSVPSPTHQYMEADDIYTSWPKIGFKQHTIVAGISSRTSGSTSPTYTPTVSANDTTNSTNNGTNNSTNNGRGTLRKLNIKAAVKSALNQLTPKPSLTSKASVGFVVTPNSSVHGRQIVSSAIILTNTIVVALPTAAQRQTSKQDGRAGAESEAVQQDALLATPSDQVLVALAEMDDWQYDTFKLSEVTGGRPLSVLAFALFKRGGIIRRFALDERKLAHFLVRIEDGYPHNPYHCREHAADVLRTLHVIATRGGLVRQAAPMQLGHDVVISAMAGIDNGSRAIAETRDALSLLTIYLAAIIHDYEHKGVNNQFLIQTSDPLAILYNDLSPMENHHASAAFTLLQDKQCNFLEHMPTQVMAAVRPQIIDMVLGTDMKQHFGLVSLFQARLTPVLAAANATAFAAAALAATEAARASMNADTSLDTYIPLAFKITRTMSSNLSINWATVSDSTNAVTTAVKAASNNRSPQDSMEVADSSGGRDSYDRGRVLRGRKLDHSSMNVQFARSRLAASRQLTTSQVDSLHSRGHSSFPSTENSGGSNADGAPGQLDPLALDGELMQLVWKMALKCADLSNLANEKSVARKWVLQLEEEMFRQGDRETVVGLPVSALMDRHKAGVTKSQPSFFSVVALPLFGAFAQIFPKVTPMLEGAKALHDMWLAEGDAAGGSK